MRSEAKRRAGFVYFSVCPYLQILARAAVKKMKDVLHHATDTLPGE